MTGASRHADKICHRSPPVTQLINNVVDERQVQQFITAITLNIFLLFQNNDTKNFHTNEIIQEHVFMT